jgi:2-keto-4-pentenoate hydratase/2-oxohepta-3-ene-1,7-dioic acid hydratase in catechol pathway
MKIVRFLRDAKACYGILEENLIRPCDGDPFSGLSEKTETIDAGSVKLLAPVSPPNIICIGHNYRGHVDERGAVYPPDPLVFMKATTSLCGPGDPIVLPADFPESIDYESELVIVIGKPTRNISEDQVPEFVLGYTIGNDVSNRAAQFKDGQWVRGKSHDTFCPLGPAIVTGIDPDNLNISSRLDGRIMQHSNTAKMIFSSRRLVAFLSHHMTLLPGTVIMSGTPEGVGYVRKPPVFLKAGQTIECIIEGIGTLANPIIASPP